VAVKAEPGIGESPIRGLTTSFVESFRAPPPPPPNPASGGEATAQGETVAAKDESITASVVEKLEGNLNFRLSKEELAAQLEKSQFLAADSAQMDQESHKHSIEAIMRIIKLDLGSSKDRLRVNVNRCIETFGRHNTDKSLTMQDGKKRRELPRGGPDVGSSEVQIAVLTAKINNLADGIDKSGKKDHHNKRNLRMLVHKRQKLLKYLRRKERGGPRWQNLVRELGLTDATWKGEIAV
jgi:ribosomal protein S15